MNPFKPISEINWRDQFAHFAVGLLLTTATLLFMHPLLGVIFTMVAAFIREMIQHWKMCGDGCRTDLLFWLLGSLAVPMVLFAEFLS